MKRSDPKGLAAALAATTAFSFGFILVKGIALPPVTIALWRLVIGSAILIAAAAWLRHRRAPLTGAVVGAGLAFGVHQILFIAATHRTSVAIVTVIGALQPILVALVSRRLLGERVPPRLLGCAILGFVGVSVVVRANVGDASRSLEGDLLAVANLFAFTAYYLFARRARAAGIGTVSFGAAFLLVALVVVGPAAFARGDALALPDPVALGMIFALALVPGNGHLLLNWAHTRISATLGSLVLAGIPVLASLWAHLVFGEPYGPPHVVGMLLVVVAITVARAIERRAEIEPVV